MEFVTVLIGVAVFIVSAVMIYLISAFSMREKTFEEVMEEQKRRQEAEFEKSRASKRAEKEQQKKKYKKGKEKVKDKPEPVPEVKEEPKMVEVQPEIIEPTESLGLNTGVRQRGKKEKGAKAVLQVKEEAPPVVEKPVVVEKIEKSKSAPKQEAKESKQKAIESKENLPPQKNEEVPKPKGTPKGTPIKTKPDEGQLNGDKLISTIKTAKLSDDQLQALVEILLNRQGLSPSMDSWNKKSQKGDPVPLLKKQLEEKEKVLQEEQNMAMAANTKVKALNTELGAEKNKYKTLEKQFSDKVALQQAELAALQQRMQHTHEQHLAETNGLQAKLQQLEQAQQKQGAGDQAANVKLAAENKILQETLGIKAKENTSLADKIKLMEKEVTKSQAAVKAVESKAANIASYEEKIKKLEDEQKEADALVNSRVEEVSVQLRKSESKNDSLASDLQNATSALTAAQAEVSTLKGKLEELETHLSTTAASKDAESKLQKDAESKLQESEMKRSDLEGNVKNLEKQLADLTGQLNAKEVEVNKLQEESQAVQENGDSHVTVEEHEKITAQLQAQVDTHAAQVVDLQTQLAQQKSKNNELETAGMIEIETNDKAVFQRLFPGVHVSDKLAHKDWVVAFEKQAASYIIDPAVSSQLEGDNKRLKEEIEQYRTIVSETENKLKQLEKSIDAEEKVWQEKLKDAESAAEKDAVSQKKISELEALVSEQEQQMASYRNILSVTESSLRDLESKVASEESDWQGKLNSSQSELSKTKEELEALKGQVSDSRGSQEMQTKVETLEGLLRESQEKIIALTTEKKQLEKKATTAEESSENSDVAELKTQIESERKKNKDLCLNVVKLNGIIKTGQDALAQEQELVKKLQEQLDYKSVKSGVSESEEIEQAGSSTENGTSV